MRLPWVAVVLAPLVAGCATARVLERPGAHSVLTVVSGETGLPVPGAVVTSGGRALRTNGRGEVALLGDGPVDVHATGYLFRESGARPEDGRISLWPVDQAYPAGYVRSLLYKPAYMTKDDPNAAPDTPLARIVATRVSVTPGPALRADAAAMQAHREAIAAINDATAGRVLFVLEYPARADVVFRTVLDTTSSADALAYRDLRAGVVTGGKVVFATLSAARDPRFLAHELGHALGLQHSTVPTDMMYFACGDRSPYTFTANERRTIRLLLQRLPGNQFPDNDRAVELATGRSASLRSTE
jgi:hypothetical protein